MSNNAVNNLNFTAGLDTDLDSDDQVPIISDGNGGSFIQAPGADGLTLWNEPIAGLTQYVGDYWDDYNTDHYVAAASHAKGSILKQDVDTAIAYTTGEFNLSPNGQKVISWQERLYTDGDDPINTSKVTAKYVDENGNMIADDVIKAGNVGDHYTTEQKAIAGYTFKKVDGPATGNFTDQEQTVTYVYSKNITPAPIPTDNTKAPEKTPTHKKSTKKSNALPKTAVTATFVSSVIGTIVIGVLGTVTLIIRHKHN